MRDRVMFLLEGSKPNIDWGRLNRGRNLVRLHNFELLTGAIDTGIRELGIEVTHVILDGSVSAEQFLGLLCELSTDFRGDLLWLAADGSGFLSGVTPGDGRVLYRVTPDDVGFYITASLVNPNVAGAFSLQGTGTSH